MQVGIPSSNCMIDAMGSGKVTRKGRVAAFEFQFMLLPELMSVSHKILHGSSVFGFLSSFFS